MPISNQHIILEYVSFDSSQELEVGDRALLELARNATKNAYAPYSHFHVGASARLTSGKLLTGSNQENASFPAGICAERSLLSAISSLEPNAGIETMAISYQSNQLGSDRPIAPCGVCRQAMMEYQSRYNLPMRIILSGQEGSVFIFPSVNSLLPLSFTPKDLGIS